MINLHGSGLGLNRVQSERVSFDYHDFIVINISSSLITNLNPDLGVQDCPVYKNHANINENIFGRLFIVYAFIG